MDDAVVDYSELSLHVLWLFTHRQNVLLNAAVVLM